MPPFFSFSANSSIVISSIFPLHEKIVFFLHTRNSANRKIQKTALCWFFFISFLLCVILFCNQFELDSDSCTHCTTLSLSISNRNNPLADSEIQRESFSVFVCHPIKDEAKLHSRSVVFFHFSDFYFAKKYSSPHNGWLENWRRRRKYNIIFNFFARDL